MAASVEETLSSATQQFVSVFGNNGSVDCHGVTRFLSSLRMDNIFAHHLKSQGKCPSHNFSSEAWYDGGRSQTELMSAIWETIQTPACYTREGGLLAIDSVKSGTEEHAGDATAIEVWGYGLLCVTVINLCALTGIAFMPVMERSFYRLLLTFMTALAVGSLVATALLILLPDSLQLAFVHEVANSEKSVIRRFASTKADKEGWAQFLADRPWYIWRCCGAFGGIYLFFVLERLLKELLGLKPTIGEHHNGHSHGNAELSTMKTEQEQLNHQQNHQENTSIVLSDSADLQAVDCHRSNSINGAKTFDRKTSLSTMSGRTSRLRARIAAVQPVAWMVLLGDSLHNLIDGISLGAAFARSPLTGFSIGLAVLCEELPHELGDFAILLSAGMSLPMAATTNLLSACACYVGFVVGVLLGEIAGFGVWIFAAGGGMFLYISLVDMMPEVNSAVDTAKSLGMSKWRVFLLQNIGLIVGYGVILLIAVFGGDIKIG